MSFEKVVHKHFAFFWWENILEEREDFPRPGQVWLSSRRVLAFRTVLTKRELVCFKYRVRILILMDKSRSYKFVRCGNVATIYS